MTDHPAIPRLTPEENAIAAQAERAGERTATAFVLAYLHWSKARGDMLASLAVQGKLKVIVSREGR